LAAVVEADSDLVVAALEAVVVAAEAAVAAAVEAVVVAAVEAAGGAGMIVVAAMYVNRANPAGSSPIQQQGLKNRQRHARLFITMRTYAKRPINFRKTTEGTSSPAEATRQAGS
jgi:hypothetical protein